MEIWDDLLAKKIEVCQEEWRCHRTMWMSPANFAHDWWISMGPSSGVQATIQWSRVCTGEWRWGRASQEPLLRARAIWLNNQPRVTENNGGKAMPFAPQITFLEVGLKPFPNGWFMTWFYPLYAPYTGAEDNEAPLKHNRLSWHISLPKNAIWGYTPVLEAPYEWLRTEMHIQVGDLYQYQFTGHLHLLGPHPSVMGQG